MPRRPGGRRLSMPPSPKEQAALKRREKDPTAARPNPTCVWLFMGEGRNTRDMRDLDHLDAIRWGSNPHARRGDLVLMYRTAPYSDIAYIFRAASDPRPTRPEDQADATHVIDLDEKVALAAPIGIETLRSERALKKK